MKMNKMRSATIALMLVTCLPAAACPDIGNVNSASEHVVLSGTKALIAAEYAYNSIGQIVLQGLLNGKIKGPDATRVREINKRAIELLIEAKHAKTEAEKASIASQLMSKITELDELRK